MLHFVLTEQAGKKSWLEMPHRLYYEFAIGSLIRVQDLAQTVHRVQTSGVPVDAAGSAALYEHRLAMNDILIYSALTLEAYINFYATRYSIPFYNDFERSLSTINKWKIYPHLKTRKTMPSAALIALRAIFDLRDEIVHPKPDRVWPNSESVGQRKEGEEKGAQAQIERLDKVQLILDVNMIFDSIFGIDADEYADHEKSPWLRRLQRLKADDGK